MRSVPRLLVAEFLVIMALVVNPWLVARLLGPDFATPQFRNVVLLFDLLLVVAAANLVFPHKALRLLLALVFVAWAALSLRNEQALRARDQARSAAVSEVWDYSLLGVVDRITRSGYLQLGSETAVPMDTPGRSVDELELTLPEGAVLDTAVGVHPDIGKMMTGSVVFEITAENESASGEPETPLTRLTVPLVPGRLNQWQPVEVDLSSLEGQTVTLRFRQSYEPAPGTEVGKPFDLSPTDLAFWRLPRVRSRAEQGPNLILVSLDTLRADHLKFMGYSRETSPTLDRLADDGVYFTRCYSQAPWTTPSHFSILTGMYPSTHGADEPFQESIRWWNDSLPTMASVLADAGYMTGAFTGKGEMSAHLGFFKGFDFYNETAPVTADTRSDVGEVFGKALAWITENDDRRFFLFVHTYEPHSPHVDERFVREERLESSEGSVGTIARYDGDIRRADDHVGALVALLEERELLDRTLVVVTSDHGEEFTEGEKRPDSGDNFGHGHTLYDEVLHVPLILRGPSLRGGVEVGSPVRLIDILPTILDYLGVAGPSQVEGRSLRPWIEGTRRDPLPVFAEATTSGTEREALRADGFKYVRRLSYGTLPTTVGAVLTPPEELYDLEQDPAETVNCVGSRPEKAEEMRSLMESLTPGKERGQSFTRPEFGVEVQRDSELQEALRALGYVH